MTANFRYHVFSKSLQLALLFAVVACVPPVRAECADNRIIALFPKDVSEFACANLDEVRLQPWFADFKGQVLPRELYGLDQFLLSAGINPASQVKQVAWSIGAPALPVIATSGTLTKIAPPLETSPDSDQFLAVIAGQFDTDSIESALEARNLACIHIGEQVLYPIANGGYGAEIYFMAIDSDTVAVGRRRMLKNLIAIQQGSAESLLVNQNFLLLINQVNDDATIYGIFNGAGTRQAIRQLTPGAGQFTDSSKIFTEIRSLVASAKSSSSNVVVRFEIATDTPQDSVMLSQILQASVLVRKYLAKESSPPDPALVTILDHFSATPNNSLVDVSFDVPNDQLRDLILTRAFGP